jgi:hypothetical protein
MEEYYAGMTMYGIAPESANLVPVTTSQYSTGMLQYGVSPSANPIDANSASYPSISNSTQLVLPLATKTRQVEMKLAEVGYMEKAVGGSYLVERILTQVGLQSAWRAIPIIGSFLMILSLEGDTNPLSIMQDKTINDFNEHPENWEKTGEKPPEPATGKPYKGGTSVEETYQDKNGRTVERHRIYDKNGKVVHEHLRVK